MPRLPRKRTIAAIILVGGTIALAVTGFRLIRHRLAYATTDAVFIRTDSLVSLGWDGVGGRVPTLGRNEGEPVAKGEILATIDDLQYRLAVTRLEAELGEVRQELSQRRLTRERLAKQSPLDEAIADDRVTQLQAEKAALVARGASVAAVIAQLERDRDRYAELVAAKAVAARKVEDLDTELSARRQEQKALEQQAAALESAESAAGKKVRLAVNNRLLVKESEQAVAAQIQKVAALSAALAQARDRLAKCLLKSLIDGRVARRFVSPGDVVEAGQAAYALLDPRDVFAVALLEENKLQGVTAGAPATLTLDAYPDRRFTAEVREVMPASAATFALVPRDISAGEFTKVAQRIPVRLAVTDGDLSLLRVGLGGEVEIKRQ